MLERRNDAERRITYEEVVKETPLPTGIGGIGSLFGPVDTSRKLKPMRLDNNRQQVMKNNKIKMERINELQASAQTGTKLLINVQSAMNLPERRGGGGALQPLVEIQFQVSDKVYSKWRSEYNYCKKGRIRRRMNLFELKLASPTRKISAAARYGFPTPSFSDTYNRF